MSHSATRNQSERRINKALTPLVNQLIHLDPVERSARVQALLTCCIPPVVSRLIARLVTLLGSDGKDGSQAADLLVEFGPQALPALELAFCKTRQPALQSRVVEVLLRLLPRLSSDQKVDLMTRSMILHGFAVDEGVQLKLGNLTAKLREPPESRAASPCQPV